MTYQEAYAIKVLRTRVPHWFSWLHDAAVVQSWGMWFWYPDHADWISGARVAERLAKEKVGVWA